MTKHENIYSDGQKNKVGKNLFVDKRKRKKISKI